ncbi:MAG: type II toxin-antitoxin system HicA family toxin [Nitrospiraceae bacterium]
MNEASSLVHLLRNLPVHQLIQALERDGITLRRSTQTGGRIYAHRDGRITVVHYHHGSDTLTRKTLKSVLGGVGWDHADAKRLGLIP